MTPPDLLKAIAEFAAANIVPTVTIAILTWLFLRFRQILPARRRWRLVEPSRLVVCIAQSADTDTGEYQRAATGIGQVKALALIAPSVATAYPGVALNDVRFPDALGDSIERDVIVLGGPKTNHIAERYFAKFAEKKLHFDANRFVHGDFEFLFPFPHPTPGTVEIDYGVVVSSCNPFSPSRHSLTLLAGLHTYGSVAAARFYLSYRRPLVKSGRDWVALVRSEVHRGHTLAPELLYLGTL